MSKTSNGLQENIASLLCYVLGWVTGLIFYLIENENETVRFHAVQSMIVFGTLNVLSIIFGVAFWHNAIFSTLLGLITFALWIILIVRAYQGIKLKLPIAGDLAEKWSVKKS
jgi:uncharacterized membrane protein